MNTKRYVSDYRKYLEENFNAERSEKEKSYLYSDLKHYGLSMPLIDKYLRTVKKEIKSLSKSDAIKLAKELWKRPSHEERVFALEVLVLHAQQLNINDMPLIEKIMRESRGWALLDSSIIPLMPGILEKDAKAYAYLKKWIKDDDFWVRRSALLAQLLFFRRNEGGDKELFFEMAKSQFDESWIDELYKDSLERKRAKFFIRKAIGWALREMSAKDPEAAYKFLLENKGEMSGLSFREGSRNLPEKMQERLILK